MYRYLSAMQPIYRLYIIPDCLFFNNSILTNRSFVCNVFLNVGYLKDINVPRPLNIVVNYNDTLCYCMGLFIHL